jgi:hypothetical protein
MDIVHLLYVSRSLIPRDGVKQAIDHLVVTSSSRNSTLALTGALLFTGRHFAQVLEGKQESVELVMAAIARDARHDQVLVVEKAPVAERRFAGWSLVYFGPSEFVSRHVTRLLSDPAAAKRTRAAEWLVELLCEFASGQDYSPR